MVSENILVESDKNRHSQLKSLYFSGFVILVDAALLVYGFHVQGAFDTFSLQITTNLIR